MDFKGFLMSDVKQSEEIKIRLSKRFTEPFVLRAITEEQDKMLREESYRKIKQRSGNYTRELDTDIYMKKLAIATVIVPDFKNAELQKNWGVLGAESLLEKMLNPGEFNELLFKVREVNGYDEEPNEIVEESKN